jgi:hypothetical protein
MYNHQKKNFNQHQGHQGLAAPTRTTKTFAQSLLQFSRLGLLCYQFGLAMDI